MLIMERCISTIVPELPPVRPRTRHSMDCLKVGCQCLAQCLSAGRWRSGVTCTDVAAYFGEPRVVNNTSASAVSLCANISAANVSFHPRVSRLHVPLAVHVTLSLQATQYPSLVAWCERWNRCVTQQSCAAIVVTACDAL